MSYHFRDQGWENVCPGLRRARVGGGWLYESERTSYVANESVPDNFAVALCFVPLCPEEGDEE